MTRPSFSKENSAQLTSGYLICLAAVFFWSFTAIFIRYLTENYNVPALPLALWRDSFVFLALVVVFAAFRPKRFRIERGQIGFLAAYGIELALFNLLWTISVRLNGAAVSTVLAYSSAAFTAVLAWRLFGESLSGAKIVAVTASLLGCILVSGAYSTSAWGLNPIGIITGLVSGLAMAIYSLFGKASARRSIDPWTALMYTFGFAAATLLVINLGNSLVSGVSSIAGLNPFASNVGVNTAWLGWIVLLMLAVGPTIGGYGLYTVSLTRLQASVANLIATLEPAMTTILAYLLLGEILTRPQYIGSALIVAGVIWLRAVEGRAGQGIQAESSGLANPPVV